MKKFKSLLGFILVFTMLVLSNNGVAYAYDTYITQCEAKIADDLSVAMDSAAEDEKIPVAIWCEEADLSNVENEAFEQMGITSEYFYGLNDSDMDNKQIMEIVQELIMTKRAIIKSIYETKNAEYFDSLGSSIDFEYFSSYAPVVIANATSDDIDNLSRNDIVSSISLDDYEECMELSISRNVVRANTMQNSALLGYTGAGVNVGICEATGLPDNSLIGLSDNKFITDPYCNNTTYYHANIVSMIIAGQGLNGNGVGIAPDVSLFSTYIKNYNFYERIGWLVEQGVNIINLSMGYTIYNTYTNYDAYLDYLSYTSNVLFVKSAGNADITGVTSPGMAYNAITVANINDNNTTDVADDALHPRQIIGENTYPGSSYINSVNISTASKPDISAPGTNIYTTEYGSRTGTSYAAPHIAGMAALLGEQQPMLLYVPAAMKAVLTAGVYPDDHSYTPAERIASSSALTPANSYIQYGAGIANCVGSALIVMNDAFDFGYFLENTTTGTYTIECTANENVRVSLSFLNNLLSFDKTNNTFEYSLPNLDLFVYDASGNLVGSSITTYNNLEIVDFTATTSGNYTIRINRVSATGEKIYYGIAWLQE